jgi:hypothetical protein
MMGSNFAAEAGQFCPISGQLIPAKKTTLAEIRSALPREEDGIIPRMLHQMFQSIDELRTKYEFLIRASFIEVYNEQVRDLLRPTNHSLKLREDNKQGLWVTDATEVPVESVGEVLELLHSGGRNRTTAPTLSNLVSSRSHAIFVVSIV